MSADITGSKVTVTTNAALQSLFNGAGHLIAVVIDSAEVGAAIEFFDGSDNSLNIKPDLDVKGRIAYKFRVADGLKYTSTGFASARVHIMYKEQDRS